MGKGLWVKRCAAVLAGITLLVGITACKEPAVEPPITNEEKIGTYVINDFSSTKALYQLIPKNMFGIINLNKDSKYILTGSGSAELRPDMSATAEPYFKQRLTSEDFHYNHGDIKTATKITAQIYNASEIAINMQTELEFSNSAKTSRESVTLKPGEWNTVTYKIYPELLSLRFNTEEAMYVNYYVERKAVEEQPVLYMDNVSISYSGEEPKPVEIALDEGEFCSFDKNYQMYLPYLVGWGNYLEEVVELTLSANPKYTVDGKGCSYKMRSVSSNSGQSYWIYFPETLCQKAKLNEVKAGDKFEFSIYNDGPASGIVAQFKVKVVMKDGTTKIIRAHSRYDESQWSREYGWGWAAETPKLAENEWTKVSIDFANVEEYTRAYLTEAYELENYDVLGNLVDFSIGWSSFNNCPEKTFYLDDLKIVKGNV